MQPLSNADHLITCDNTTSTNESHASLSVKVSSVLKNIVFCLLVFLLSMQRAAKPNILDVKGNFLAKTDAGKHLFYRVYAI